MRQDLQKIIELLEEINDKLEYNKPRVPVRGTRVRPIPVKKVIL